MELGVFSFGDVQRTKDGKLGPTHESVTNLLEAIQLADKVGLDVFGIGEHHTEYFRLRLLLPPPLQQQKILRSPVPSQC